MSVELIPNNTDCIQIGLANGTFFTMVNTSTMAELIGVQHTTDPVEATAEQARACADALRSWSPPDSWMESSSKAFRKEVLDDLITFFETCEGFTTN